MCWYVSTQSWLPQPNTKIDLRQRFALHGGELRDEVGGVVGGLDQLQPAT